MVPLLVGLDFLVPHGSRLRLSIRHRKAVSIRHPLLALCKSSHTTYLSVSLRYPKDSTRFLGKVERVKLQFGLVYCIKRAN